MHLDVSFQKVSFDVFFVNVSLWFSSLLTNSEAWNYDCFTTFPQFAETELVDEVQSASKSLYVPRSTVVCRYVDKSSKVSTYFEALFNGFQCVARGDDLLTPQLSLQKLLLAKIRNAISSKFFAALGRNQITPSPPVCSAFSKNHTTAHPPHHGNQFL
jgi:hypothetical protein